MNSLKKYPKLSCLFITRIVVALLFLGTIYYLHKDISENLELLRTAQFENSGSPIERELRVIFEADLNSYEHQINSNINLIMGVTIIFILLNSYINSLVKRENKRLDKIEQNPI